MSNRPFFSIIIPTLNEEKFLPRLLTDLANQTSTDYEVIVVDAKSTDKTQTLAQSFQTQLPHLRLLETSFKNVSRQRNLGAKYAQGKIILFIDADTGLPKFFLDGIKYRLSKRPADLFTTWMKPDSNHPQDATITAITNLTFEIGRLIDLPAGMGSMLGFRKKVFKKLKGFNETISYAEDQELIRRAIELGYKFLIYSDPQFVWSFRRFRKQGTLSSLRQFAKLQTKILSEGYPKNANYPMGGHHFDQTASKPSFLNRLSSFLKI